jgi:hypothetical protein
MLLAFSPHLTAPPSGSLGNPYTIELWTTGGSASKWVVDWGDGTPGHPDTQTFTAPPGGFPTPQPESHTYNQSPTTPLTAQATLSVSPFTVVSTSYALSSHFGTYTFQGSGQTAYTPFGSSGGAKGAAMVYAANDACTTGSFLYVASQYSGNRMAVTRFTAPTASSIGGVVDISWGNNGTIVLQPFGSGAPGTTEVDTPTAIAFDPDGGILGLVGQAAITVTATHVTTYSWAVAEINTPNGGSIAGQASLTGLPSSTNSAVKATSVLLTNDNPVSYGMVVAGTDGNTMVVGAFAEGAPTIDTTFGTGGTGLVSIAGTSGANTVIQAQEPNTSGDLLVGGYTTYSGVFHTGCCGGCCAGGIPYTASDFTIVRLNTDGTLDRTFGSGGIVRTNFAGSINGPYGECNTFGCCGGGCNVPSFDSDYSLMEWNGNTTGTWQIIAVGSSTPFLDPVQWGLVRYNESNGSRDIHFGQYGSGVAVPGVPGVPYSAALEGSGGFASATNDTNVKIIATGAANNDFATARFTNTTTGGGALDHTFGSPNTGYVMYSDFGTSSASSIDSAFSLALITGPGDDLATDILVGGSTNTNGGQIALADYLTSNSPVVT